jgi:hypothetical protein
MTRCGDECRKNKEHSLALRCLLQRKQKTTTKNPLTQRGALRLRAAFLAAATTAAYTPPVRASCGVVVRSCTAARTSLGHPAATPPLRRAPWGTSPRSRPRACGCLVPGLGCAVRCRDPRALPLHSSPPPVGRQCGRECVQARCACAGCVCICVCACACVCVRVCLCVRGGCAPRRAAVLPRGDTVRFVRVRALAAVD